MNAFTSPQFSPKVDVFSYDEVTLIFDRRSEAGLILLGDDIIGKFTPIPPARLKSEKPLLLDRAIDYVRRIKNTEAQDWSRPDGSISQPLQNQLNSYTAFIAPNGKACYAYCIGDGSRVTIPVAKAIGCIEKNTAPDYFYIEDYSDELVQALRWYAAQNARKDLLEIKEIRPGDFSYRGNITTR